jgi:hypothetical protein
MYIDGHNVRCKKEERENESFFFIKKKTNSNDFTMHKTIPFKFGIAVAVVVLI